MTTENPNAKYDHVYAIIRLDKDVVASRLPDRNLIVVTKVVRSKEVAEQEVRRLSALNADKGCEYFYQITRLEKQQRKQGEEAPMPTASSTASQGP